MELTNNSFLTSRNDYLTAIAERKVNADRIATGKRLERSGTDVGAIHQAAYQTTEITSDLQSIANLRNLRSFLSAQENSLRRVHEMYDRMEVLAIKAANPITRASDRADYEIEYNAYREQLEEIMKSRYNGTLLFSSTEMCGGPVDVVLQELDASTNAKKNAPGGTHIVRAQTQETGSPSGTVSLRVNSGPAGDTYRVWMGDICVFSAGPEFKGSPADLYEEQENGNWVGKNYNGNAPFSSTGTYSSDQTHSYNYTKANGDVVTVIVEEPTFAYSGNGWRTSGNAANGDDDLFEIRFGPGEKTTYTLTPGSKNDRRDSYSGNHNSGNITPDLNLDGIPDGDGISDYNPFDQNTGLYTNIITKDLPEDFDRTEMTIQVETNTIGVIYEEGASSGNGETIVQERDSAGNLVFNPDGSAKMVEADKIDNSGVSFTPTPFIRYIPKDRHGNMIELDPKGFDRFEDTSLTTPVSAQDVVDKMRGNNGYFGEMKCIVENRIGILGSEYKRVDYEINALEQQVMEGKLALSRIKDADMARETTELARNSLRSELATQILSNTARLKDILIPLTTDHFRGEAMSLGL